MNFYFISSRKLHLGILALLLSFTLFSNGRNILSASQEPEAVAWADSIYNTLSDRDRVAQLMCPKILPGLEDESRAKLRQYVGRDQVGGLLFAGGTLAEYVEMVNYAQSLARIPLLMTFDGEWGVAMRVKETTRFPVNMALGAIADTVLMYRYGAEVARQLRLIGHNVDFAPDVDVNSNPSNPVIGKRSFGEDAARVAGHSLAFARGLEDNGVMAVAKHFPGHGDTTTDSHLEKTTVSHSLDTLYNIDLYPFRRFIDSGLSGVMTGHIIVPALDASGYPASLSRKMTTDLLRGQMGFEGLIFTDALSMKGAHVLDLLPPVEALIAGADVLLCAEAPEKDIDAVLKAVDDGRVTWSTIEDRCKRILRFKYALGLDRPQTPVQIDGLAEKINTPYAENLVRQLADASMTLLRNEDNTLPIGRLANNSIAVVIVGEPKHDLFGPMCRKYAPVSVYRTQNENIDSATMDSIMSHNTVIAAVYTDKPYAEKIYDRLKDAPNLVSVFMTTPYEMAHFEPALNNSKAILMAYEGIPAMQRAAAKAIFGGIDVAGRLPVNIPGFPIGSGIDLAKTRLGYSSPLAEGISQELPARIDSLVAGAMNVEAFPGCQVLVARNGNIVFEKSYGAITAGGAAVTDSTLYDLASVSKVIGTLPGIMKAYDMKLFDLDRPAADHISGLRENGKIFTPRQMLYHETGMPAAINVYSVMLDENGKLRHDITSPVATENFPWEAAKGIWVGPSTVDTIMNVIYRQPLRPNKDYNYSCLNFCLLLDMEQRLTGQPHDRWVTDSIFAPLGMYNTVYRPSVHVPLNRIAPTENDSIMRHQIVQGYVHDETAAMLGGVSGNAGLFANAGDIAKLCQTWLQGGMYGDTRILSPETVNLFMTSKSPTCRRGLGFDKPDPNPDNSPTCAEASPSVIGHTGFTGTIFWIDPDLDLIYVFLTNRVNPSRINPAFAKSGIRSKIFSTIYESIQH